MNARRRVLFPALVLAVLGASLVSAGPAAAACDQTAKFTVLEATSANVEAIVSCGRESQTSLAFGPNGTLDVAIPALDESLTLFATYAEGTQGVTSAKVSRFKDGGVGFAYEENGRTVVGGDKQGIQKMNDSLVAASPVSAAWASGCSSSSYSVTGSFQVGSFHYSVNTSGLPAGGLARIQAAANAVSAASDNCGLAGSTGIPAVYDGTTTYTTNVTFTGGCLTQDSISVQKFGTTSASVVPVAITCVTANGYNWILHTDTLYRNAFSWYAGSSTTGCTGTTYDLQGIATHEIGHAYGLNHAGDATQVMYASAPPCDTGDRLLGSGDHKGLMFIY